MKAFKFILAGGAGIAALAAAAPASAQYYPGYGYGGGNVLGQVLGQVLGGGYGGYGAYGGMNSQAAVGQCSAAVADRLNRQYGGYAGYGGYNSYNGYGGGARVVQITQVEPRTNGRMRVRGIAQTNTAANYGGGYGQAFSFKCNVDYRGYISDIDLDRINTNYGNSGYSNGYYSPYGNYRRY